MAQPGNELRNWRRRLCGHLFNATPAAAAPILLVAFMIVAATDILSPRYITFGAFYLVIIAYASWTIARWAGWLAAVSVSAVSICSDGFGGYVALAQGNAHLIAIVWSLAMRLLSSAAIVELVRGFRHSFDHARRLGDTDPLTGLLNGRAFKAAAAKRLTQMHAAAQTAILIYCDLDGFKQVNDHFGHAAGDHVLKSFADLLAASASPNDIVGRLGGDEFIILMPVPNRSDERQTVLKIQRQLKSGLSSLGYTNLSCSLGAAVASSTEDAPDLAELIKRADDLMYKAKHEHFLQLESRARPRRHA